MIEYSDSTFTREYSDIPTYVDGVDKVLGGVWANPANHPHQRLANRTKWLKKHAETNRDYISGLFTDATANSILLQPLGTQISQLESDTTILYQQIEYDYIEGFRNYRHTETNPLDNNSTRIFVHGGVCVGYGHPDGTNADEITLIDSINEGFTGSSYPVVVQETYVDATTDATILIDATIMVPEVQNVFIIETIGGTGGYHAGSDADEARWSENDADWQTGAYYIYILKATDNSVTITASRNHEYPDLTQAAGPTAWGDKWLNGYYRRIGSFIRVTAIGAVPYEAFGDGLDRKILYDRRMQIHKAPPTVDNYNYGVAGGYYEHLYLIAGLVEIKDTNFDIALIPRHTVRSSLLYFRCSELSFYDAMKGAATNMTLGGYIYAKTVGSPLTLASSARLIGMSHAATEFELAVSQPSHSTNYSQFQVIQDIMLLFGDSGVDSYLYAYPINFYCFGYTEEL